MRRLAGISMLLLTGMGLVGSLGTTTSCGSPVEVRSVYMALDGAGNRRRTHFYTDTNTIFCNVDFVGDRQDLTVNAVLRQTTSENCPSFLYPDPAKCGTGNPLTTSWGQPLIKVNYVLSVLEQAPGVGSTTIAFSWSPTSGTEGKDAASAPTSGTAPPPPWPVGQYRCDIYVDGKLQGGKDFDIRFPGPEGAAFVETDHTFCPDSPVKPGVQCWDYVLPGATCKTAFGAVCKCPTSTGVWELQ